MLTRRAFDPTARFRPIADALAKLPAKTAYLVGEISLLAEYGMSSFATLQDSPLAPPGRAAGVSVYLVFDFLHLDDHDLLLSTDRAHRLGRGGRKFQSCRADHSRPS
jgi:bifunctional non-homologous end joining protein LigD